METAVSTYELTKIFDGFTAVDKITCSVNTGEVCGFLGPNGAGKSTAIRMLCGILEPTSGQGQVLGYDLQKQAEEIKRHIGYMSQKFSLYDDLDPWQNLEFYAGLYGLKGSKKRSRIDEMIELAGLTGRETQLTATLSLGYKQRLALGCALLSRPQLLFLDEPTSGVSPSSRKDFFNIIQELAAQGTTVIVTTHFMDEAERCDRIAFFRGGKLLALESPDYLKQQTMSGILFLVNVPDPMVYLSRLKQLPGVTDCSLHGSSLHVWAADQGIALEIAAITGSAPAIITPSLEDVFIALSSRFTSD